MTDRCGSRDTHNGEPCGRQAGWGTDHKGEGFCADHDEDLPPRAHRLTPDTEQAICSMLEAGHSIRAACEVNGLSRDRYYKWREIGEKSLEDGDENEFTEFYRRTTMSRAVGQRNVYESMMDAATERADWRAFLEVLKRQFPDDWGDSIDLGPEGKIIFVDHAESDKSTDERVNLDETRPDASRN